MDLRPHLRWIEPLRLEAPALEAMDRFRRDGHADFMPVVRADGTVAGVVRESSIRRYLLSLFGHELLHRRTVQEFLTPWTTVPIDCTEELALAHFASSASREGLVVVEGERYAGVLATHSLLALYESHRQKIQERLLQAQKMEAIGTLAGGIAHDFNNLLNPIQGYAELLCDRLEGKAKSQAECILQATDRAKDLVQQILAFSRPQAKSTQVVRLGGLLREVARLVEVRLPEGISLLCGSTVESDWVATDATRLHQVLMNLCTNAVHAMKGRSGLLELRVEAWDGPVEGWCDREGDRLQDHLCLSVRDEGCGMPPELLPRIFEPFFTTRRAGEGTGLGLALAHGLARQSGGCLSVSSVPGAGTTFRIYLPRCAAPPGAEPEAPPPRGPRSLLLVDDEVANLDLLCAFLEDRDCTVARFTSPRKALEALAEAPQAYHLMITDLAMPGMTGDVLARKAKAMAPGLVVFLLTGHAASVDPGQCQGIDLVLPKPMRLRDLDTALREWLP